MTIVVAILEFLCGAVFVLGMQPVFRRKPPVPPVVLNLLIPHTHVVEEPCPDTCPGRLWSSK